jgi:hypothetical protein
MVTTEPLHRAPRLFEEEVVEMSSDQLFTHVS